MAVVVGQSISPPPSVVADLLTRAGLTVLAWGEGLVLPRYWGLHRNPAAPLDQLDLAWAATAAGLDWVHVLVAYSAPWRIAGQDRLTDEMRALLCLDQVRVDVGEGCRVPEAPEIGSFVVLDHRGATINIPARLTHHLVWAL